MPYGRPSPSPVTRDKNQILTLYENRHGGAEDDMSVLDSGYMYVSIGPPSQQTKRMPVKPDTEVAGHAEGIGDAFAGDASGRLARPVTLSSPMQSAVVQVQTDVLGNRLPYATRRLFPEYMYILMAMLCYALHCESDAREEEKQIRSTYYYASSRMAWLDAFALWQRVAHHHRPMEVQTFSNLMSSGILIGEVGSEVPVDRD
ncbi:hypothetical protein CCUS01_17141 [Colletotrichum cuscutae]|uniref:Uncharacterized protein n=1 Tax=Colletotrichum cuscutae TaxID=1209917 RepID=A0AAI9VAK3_9PEZI|nr:hypothetical protein CCUS01_17141 [Colletotrichum cuscutae]